MKIFSLLFVTTMILAPLTACAGNNQHIIDASTQTSTMKEWSVDDHLAAAKNHEQEAQRIIAKVEKMVQQISELTNKPYLDPKSLRRDSLKRISGNLIGKLRTLNTQIAWHNREAAQMMAMNDKQQKES